MPTNILMPALSPTMEKGNLAKWLKKEGDKVKSGDVIAEIETDKATMEVEAVDEGTLAKIVVPEGTQDVPVNDVIAVLAGEGEDVKAAAAGAKAAPAAKPADGAEARGSATKDRCARSASRAAAETCRALARRKPRRRALATRIFSSPLARRLAKDAGIDLARVGAPARMAASSPAISTRRNPARACGRRAPRPQQRQAAPSLQQCRDQQILALYEPGATKACRTTACAAPSHSGSPPRRRSIPHFYLTIDCDIGKLAAAREEINAAAPKDKDGKPAYKLSVNDFVIKALALALQRCPTRTSAGPKPPCSSTSIPTSASRSRCPAGLITPIVRNAETKSLSAISNEMKDLAARAKAQKLKPDEYQGGTSAVSNLGMYGINDFTAVINPPQATILAVGAGEERAVVRNGKLAVAHIMSVTLSCDHRAIDGALGAELIGAFKTLIENPVMMVV